MFEVFADGDKLNIKDVKLSVDQPTIVTINSDNTIIAGTNGNAKITVEYYDTEPVTVDVTVT